MNSAPAPSHYESVTIPVQAIRSADEKPLTARWLELENFSHSERYRSAFLTGDQPGAPAQGGYRLFGDGQQRSLIQGKIKLDKDARYTVNVRASSGRYFNWAFADYIGKGIGTHFGSPLALDNLSPAGVDNAHHAYCYLGPPCDVVGSVEYSYANVVSRGWEFYVRELYVSATPVEAITVEFGSMGIERGYSSEITTFDDDGFIAGERVRIHDPRHLFFDEIGFTNAFFGDVTTPNLFRRGLKLDQSNYRQIFVDKKITPRVAASGEYTWQTGTDTLRGAVRVQVKEIKVADSVRVEAYSRLNDANLQSKIYKGGSGFAVAADRNFGSKVSGDLGFDRVDQNYCVYADSWAACAFHLSLNGDSYTQGKRYFSHVSYKVNPSLTASGFYTHAIGHDIVNFNQQNFNFGLTLDLKALVDTKKRVF